MSLVVGMKLSPVIGMKMKINMKLFVLEVTVPVTFPLQVPVVTVVTVILLCVSSFQAAARASSLQFMSITNHYKY
jgi:ABC-type lipoprotein release transport system permease subunit